MGCLNCKKELEQLVGKRQKQFCNSTCRSNYWQKAKRKKSKEPPKVIEIEKPKFDFGDDAFLFIEKFTKYPKNDRPTNQFLLKTWLIDKGVSDNEIKIAWAEHLKSK